MTAPKKPKKTAEEAALEIRQRSLLDKEIADEEEAFRLLTRGKLGRQSLLSGSPRTQTERAGVGNVSRASGIGSLLTGGGRGVTSASGLGRSRGIQAAK